ncbi:MAG: helix-turn-helix domain-containing protein [Raineya sp.]|jgi:transcriptional regulator with XRE-family HTH domain|nr:helix-turn-helix domain-containing protein [Raineya sp.]
MENIQVGFLQKIKDLLPSHISLVDELSELLNLSNDSVYRRIRGETTLSLEEAFKIAEKYKISLDTFLNQKSQTQVVFEYDPISTEGELIAYLNMILTDLQLLKEKKGYLIYSATDLPIFYNFTHTELAAFKLYSWIRYTNHIEIPSKFEYSLIPKELINLCKQIYHAYQIVRTSEIWTDYTIDSTLRQIEYYYDLGLFANPEDAQLIVKQLQEIIQTIQKQASDQQSDFELYQSEVTLDNNCILSNIQGVRKVYLRHQNLNVLITQNTHFCEETENDLNTTLSKSMLVSGISERQRYQFFQKIYQKCENTIQKLK